jgi:hypothetical protein
MSPIADPRPSRGLHSASRELLEVYELAQRSLAAASGQESARCDVAITVRLERLLEGDGTSLAALLEHAPSLDIYRHVWRLLARRAAFPLPSDEAIAPRLFAISLVLVAALTDRAAAAVALDAIVRDIGRLNALLAEHGALNGNRNFALSSALVSSQAIDVPRLPALMRAAGALGGPLDLEPVPIDVQASEAAHLRFLVGTAIAARDAELFGARDPGAWGLPVARTLMAGLARPGVSLVVLPRATLSLPAAVAQGRAAQREVAAQLYASHALRELRASVGEPVAIVSAHRTDEVASGGELRLSLSSPFSPRDAYGFRSELFVGENVSDALSMLIDLLRDCRVADVRIVGGVHADRDPITGGPLLFKPETMPVVH